MSDYKDVSLNKVIVTQKPEVESIIPKSGKYEGKETDVATFNVAENKYIKTPNGFEPADTEFHSVKVYGSDAKEIAAKVQVGMSLNITGSQTIQAWTDKEGVERTTSVVNARGVGLDLSQERVRSIDFAPKKELSAEAQATAGKSNDKPIEQRPKAGYNPAAKAAGLSA